MRRIRTTTALGATLALLTVAAWFASAPAQAAYIATVAGGVLTLTGTTGVDSSTVTCSVGQVKIDGSDPSSGAVNCDTISSVVVSGKGGNDLIYLDAMTAGVFPTLTTQTINGGSGVDQLVAAPVPGTINAGGGDDRIYPGPGNQTITGGVGRDTVFDLTAAGATVTDTSLLTPSGGTDSLSGIEEVFLTGTNASETFDLTGFSGASTVNGSIGDDTIDGGSGSDFVIAGEGADTVNGNGGADTIVPNDGDDVANGGSGTDTVLLGDDGMTVTDASATGPFIGSDTLASFEVANLLMFSAATLDASGFTGVVIVTGSVGDDTILSGPGADSITAGAGNDEIRTGAGSDTLRGEAGNDLLIAGAGNDGLFGGPGTDDCNGGPGVDTLHGCP